MFHVEHSELRLFLMFHVEHGVSLKRHCSFELSLLLPNGHLYLHDSSVYLADTAAPLL